MTTELEQLIATERRLDDVVSASDTGAARLIEEARVASEATKAARLAELAVACADVERRAAALRNEALAELEATSAREREVFDTLEEAAIDRLAEQVIDRVLRSLEEEVGR
jgi:hypothetical protein